MNSHLDIPELTRSFESLRAYLMRQPNEQGFWEGRLSSSPLANAVAAFALCQVDPARHADLVARALRWLAEHANPDGGWGDTLASPSNISSTLLCWSALHAAGADAGPSVRSAIAGAEQWLRACAGSLEPAAFARCLRERYGSDNTFSVPILAMCARAGRLGPDGFRYVVQPPFELTFFPHRLYRWLDFSVVSYGMPALLAIGWLRHYHRPTRNPMMRALRNRLLRPALREVARMQPAHGGYQDSAVLTGFVVLGLAGAGLAQHPIVEKGVAFLLSHVREDGSWPVDTNLSTWLSSLAVRALYGAGPDLPLPEQQRADLLQWLLDQQHAHEHPMTHSAPGGWGWTDQPGSIPDADDTASVLLALPLFGEPDEQTLAAGSRAVRWLIDLQNRDGGMPTFCRGWGRLRFDRSCPDITASALLALDRWESFLAKPLRSRLQRAAVAAVGYLRRAQRRDGAWLPLWFWNRDDVDGGNPVYGTARAVLCLRKLQGPSAASVAPLVAKGVAFLLNARPAKGGWGAAKGAAPSVEETALALSALAGIGHDDALAPAVRWLIDRIGSDPDKIHALRRNAAPIGLYFDRLAYFEELYPVIFAVEALGRLRLET